MPPEGTESLWRHCVFLGFYYNGPNKPVGGEQDAGTTVAGRAGADADPWVGASIDCEEKILQAHRLGATLITCNNGDEVLAILRRLGLHP